MRSVNQINHYETLRAKDQARIEAVRAYESRRYRAAHIEEAVLTLRDAFRQYGQALLLTEPVCGGRVSVSWLAGESSGIIARLENDHLVPVVSALLEELTRLRREVREDSGRERSAA